MTAITKYFVGGEVEAFYASGPAGLTWTTTAGQYDSNFSRGAVTVINPGSLIYIPATFATPTNTFWFSIQEFRTTSSTNISSTTWIELVDNSLVPMYRVQGIGGILAQPVIQFQYWSGSAWVAAPGTAIVCPQGVLHKFDFNIDNATGGVKAYMDGIPFASGTGLPNHTISQVQLYSVSGATFSTISYSECMCFDVSTLGRRLYTLGETANGTNSDWSGAYTDINEIGTFNDSNFIQTGTVNQTSTFVTSTISSTPSQQYLVSGLIIAGRLLIGAVGPQNLKGAVVVSGTTYDSTDDVANLLTVFGYSWADFPVNPNTGVDWTIGIINGGIETGWKSLT